MPVSSRQTQTEGSTVPCEKLCDPDQAKLSGRAGLWLGAIAVVFWSFGSSLIYLGAKEAGTWRFVAIAASSSGLLQIISRWFHQGEIRTALLLPWRLWAVPLVCFVLYGLAWPCALAASSAGQVAGVNLINYLWPVLTVLFSVWWVPGLRLTRRLVAALGLAAAGLLCANAQEVRHLLSGGASDEETVLHSLAPYLLALVAAVTWAVYSAVLARWRSWAKNYVTSPVGFLVIGAIASLVLMLKGEGAGKLSRSGLWLTLLYGFGPLAAGYLLWELALAKAKIQSLSLIAAATPVLSTLLLSCFLKKAPGPDLILAALLISAGLVLSLRE